MCVCSNQHALEGLDGEVQNTPFWKALALPSCQGMVQVMDHDCTPHRRVWCILEIFACKFIHAKEIEILSMINPHYMAPDQYFDGVPVPTGPALRDANGEVHLQHQGVFPFHVAVVGASVDIEDAQTSCAQDKENILRMIRSGHSYDEVNLSVRGLFRGPALSVLAMRGEQQHAELRRMLSEAAAAEVNFTNSIGASPLYAAAEHGDAVAAQLLLTHQADVNLAKHSGTTPLYIASEKGHTDVVKLLVEHKADPSLARRDDGCTPMRIAEQQCHAEIVDFLQALDTSGDQPSQTEASSKLPKVPAGRARSKSSNRTRRKSSSKNDKKAFKKHTSGLGIPAGVMPPLAMGSTGAVGDLYANLI